MHSPNVNAVVASLRAKESDQPALDYDGLPSRDRQSFDELPVFLEQLPASKGKAQDGRRYQQRSQAELKPSRH
jgi:hypothetical protein